MCAYVRPLACIYSYGGKSEDKAVVRMAEKRDKNISLCSGNCFRPFGPFDFSWIPQDPFSKHVLRAGTTQSPGDSLKELGPEEE